MKIKAIDVQPGSKVEVFGEIYFIRYIRYYHKEIQLALQPAHEPLSPFIEHDAITMNIENELMVEVKE